MSLKATALLLWEAEPHRDLDLVLLGVGLAYAAVRIVVKYTSKSSLVRKILSAPCVKVANLRSLLTSDQSQPSDGNLVEIEGAVDTLSNVDGKWNIFNSGVLTAYKPGRYYTSAIIRRTRTDLLRWNSTPGPFWKWEKPQRKISFQKVPFVLRAEPEFRWRVPPGTEYVVVNLDGSTQPLPLVCVDEHVYSLRPSLLDFLKKLVGIKYPAGCIDRVEVLQVGRQISAIGLCSMKDGVLEIKSCNDLPYFLSRGRYEIIKDLTSHTNLLFDCAIVLSAMSIGLLGFAVARYWIRWEVRRRRRQLQQSKAVRRGQRHLEQSTCAAASLDEAQIQEEEDVGRKEGD